MMAVVTVGIGSYDMLQYRQVPVPVPGVDDVLLQVLAAGVNNTEINTRVGWYDADNIEATSGTSIAVQSDATPLDDSSAKDGWDGPTPFPLIQGTDCCGRVVAVGANVTSDLLGSRSLVRACMRTNGFGSLDAKWMASNFDGAFAQFVRVPASEVFPLTCDLSDAELATVPCAYATAENMLHRCNVRTGQHALITGASGGVGAAAVQLAKLRGATVTAVASRAKHGAVLAIGADRVLDRADDPLEILGTDSIDTVVDNVAGNGFAGVLETLKRGGKYVSSGAIGGPVVSLDMRTFYLKDLTLIGCTAWDEPVFPNLIKYLEAGDLKPLLAKTFPLENIEQAQREFLEKKHVGNFVLIPSHH